MFDKYAFYERAVQDTGEIAGFLDDVYRELRGRAPVRLGEDFCGAFGIAAEWARLGEERTAVAVDLDEKPLAYGRRRLAPGLAKRVRVVHGDVRKKKLPAADLICALNFSYCTFQTRKLLKDYFVKTVKRLPKGGMLVIDVLSGTDTSRLVEDQVDYGDFAYFWEQASFDPITRRAVFHIHFQLAGEARRRNRVFTYDWRLWTVPELRELLEEVGFRRTEVFWQGDESTWVAYIAALV